MNTYTVNAFEFDDLEKDARATALGFMTTELESDEYGQLVAITQEIEDGPAGALWRSYGIEPHVSGFVWSLFGQGSGAGPDGLPIDDARPLLRAAGIDLRTRAARRVIELTEAGRLSTRTNERTPFLTELAVRTDWEDEGGVSADVFAYRRSDGPDRSGRCIGRHYLSND